MIETRQTKKMLQHFQCAQASLCDGYGEEIGECGKEIADLLKSKTLTYEQAYASLQYCYELLLYESNFLHLLK